MLQVYILYKNDILAIVGKRDTKEVFQIVEMLKSPYTNHLREKDCVKKPRYGYHLIGLQRAIQEVKNSQVYNELNNDEQICFILGCINIINWFDKGKAVAPYIKLFNDICGELDDIYNPVNFVYNETGFMENRYCRKENIENEQYETMGDFFKTIEEEIKK